MTRRAIYKHLFTRHMQTSPAKTGIFVTATDTEVGKTETGTLVTQFLTAQGYRVAVRKPVESGCTENENGELEPADAHRLWDAAGRREDLMRVCPIRLRHALSPARAAALESVPLTLDHLQSACAADAQDFLWVEGAGGFYSPLAQDGLNADLAQRLDLPLLLVSPDRLGTINHVLLCAEAIAHRGLKLAAVILNQVTPEPLPDGMDNLNEIRPRVSCPVIRLPFRAGMDAVSVQALAGAVLGAQSD
ncbi:MAG: dethiobiotin synthase [Gammaproteobacteria bacterium]|jgi:dethiobiotin synthetase